MNITLTDKAINWFEKEMGVEKGKGVRFFGKTYGKTEVHEGFSVGISVEEPDDQAIGKAEINGITYFAASQDDWFYNGYDLEIDFDEKKESPIYHFHEQK